MAGISGSWSNQVVTAVVIQSGGNFQGLFIYSGTPASGNLIGSWSATAGTDPFGNKYPAGLYATQGQLFGMLINGSTITASTILNGILSLPMITNPTITGGTLTETTITFDSTGGRAARLRHLDHDGHHHERHDVDGSGWLVHVGEGGMHRAGRGG